MENIYFIFIKFIICFELTCFYLKSMLNKDYHYCHCCYHPAISIVNIIVIIFSYYHRFTIINGK